MSQKTLQEMDANEFLAKVDGLLEHLERQIGEDSVGDWAVSAGKDEIRRRILKPADPIWEKLFSVPITVEVEKLDLDDVVLSGYPESFNGTPYLITAVGLTPGVSEPIERTTAEGFFSASEAKAFLTGLQTARVFGLSFKEIPDIEDISEREVFGEGVD